MGLSPPFWSTTDGSCFVWSKLPRVLSPLRISTSPGRTVRLRCALFAALASCCKRGPTSISAPISLKLLVPLSAHLNADVRAATCTSLRSTFEQDIDGEVSLEIAREVAALVKKRQYLVPPDTIAVFESLSLTGAIASETDGADQATKRKDKKKDKRDKKDKKERKSALEFDVDRNLQEADANSSRHLRNRNVRCCVDFRRTELRFFVWFECFLTVKAANRVA